MESNLCSVLGCDLLCNEVGALCSEHGCEHCGENVKFGCRYCVKCKCNVPGCPRLKSDDSVGCSLHSCHICKREIRIGFPKHPYSFATTYCPAKSKHLRRYSPDYDSDLSDDSSDKRVTSLYCIACTCIYMDDSKGYKGCNEPIDINDDNIAGPKAYHARKFHACKLCHKCPAYNGSLFCVNCKCAIPECVESRIDGTEACESHACKECHGNAVVTTTADYCRDCICAFKECSNKRLQTSKACENHTCKLCTNSVKKEAQELCANCCCMFCDKPSVKDGVCGDHLCVVCKEFPTPFGACPEHFCHSEGCNQPVCDLNAIACVKHVCVVCKKNVRYVPQSDVCSSCANRRCMYCAKQSVKNGACDDHLCIVCKSPTLFGGVCLDHFCHSYGCNQLAYNSSSTACAKHMCPVCKKNALCTSQCDVCIPCYQSGKKLS